MPACLTHYYFAKTVARFLGETGLEKSPEYLWGAQGPDFLFCHRYLPWMKGRNLRDYGDKLTFVDVMGAVTTITGRLVSADLTAGTVIVAAE